MNKDTGAQYKNTRNGRYNNCIDVHCIGYNNLKNKFILKL